MADQDQPITGDGAGNNSPAPPEASPLGGADAAAPRGAPRSARLPVVTQLRAPLADDDASIIDEWPAPRLSAPPRAAARRRWLDGFTGRAAVIGAAAAIGGLVGAAAMTGMGQVFAARDDGPDAGEAVEALRSSIGELAGEIKALKDGVGEGSRTAASGLASLDDRLAGAEQAQADLTAQIASLTTSLSRAAVASPPPVSPEITGSIARSNLPVASDWVLWRVRNGRALVQGNGGYFEVVPGSQLPGLGIVERIIKENGRWVVMTRNAVIVSRG